MSTRDRLLLFVFVALVAGAAFLWTQPARRTAYLQQASLGDLEREAKQSPEDIKVLQSLGEKQRAAGNLQAAYDAFAKASDLSPSNFEVWNATSELAETIYGRQGAFDLMGTYVRNNPKEARGYLAMARLYFLSQAHERAIQSAKTAIQLNPKLAEAWRILGWEAMVNDARKEAEDAMRQALAIDPQDFRNHVGLADVLVTQQKYDEAISLYHQAQKIAPKESNIPVMLARALLKSRPDDSQVIPEVEPLVRQGLTLDDGRAVTHAILGEVFERKGEVGPAIQEYETAIRLNPDNADTIYRLAQLYRRQKDEANFRKWLQRHRDLQLFLSSQKLLRQKIQEEKDPIKAHQLSLDLANQTAAVGAVGDAVEQLRTLLKKQADPTVEAVLHRLESNPDYHAEVLLKTPTPQLLEHATELRKSGKPAEAASLYFAAIQRNRFSADALLGMGLSLQAQGKADAAIPFLADALRNSPELPQAHFALGDIAADFKLLETARGHYDAGLKRDKENAEAWFRLGEICREAQRESESREAFQHAYLLSPKTPRYAREWADTQQETGKPADAESTLRLSLKDAPQDSETLALLGSLLMLKPDGLTEAETVTKQSLAVDSTNDFARLTLAQIYLKQKRPAEARPSLEELSRRNPRAREIWFTLGQTYRALGDTAKAQKSLDQARILEQQFLAGRTLSERLALHPEEQETRVKLARLQLQAGEPMKALSNYEEAVRKTPTRADWKKERDTLRQQLLRSNTLSGLSVVTQLHESIPTTP